MKINPCLKTNPNQIHLTATEAYSKNMKFKPIKVFTCKAIKAKDRKLAKQIELILNQGFKKIIVDVLLFGYSSI